MATNENFANKNKINRPTSITVISIFYWINAVTQGAMSIIGFTRLLGSISEGPDSIPAISILLPIGNMVLVACFVVVGWGLWQLKQWGRLAAITLSGLMIAISLFMFAFAIIYGQFSIPYNIVFHGLVLSALFGANVKAAFQSNST